ncbi:cation/H(+) antiporter 15-like [Magnolia sinica]|uniref:cation/H(+) antiporter 15-like n=1 Tax=Magnolia sinica TaxID=86752 RepID=UPI00265B0012|nr:cation/H(+) antiporter 15-like [Magnolia sinica]
MDASVVLRAARGLNATRKQASDFKCFNVTKVNSLGYFHNDYPSNFSLPRLFMQIGMVTIITRAVRFVMTPLKQPKIVSDLIGGIIVGPSVLGSIKFVKENVFSEEGMYILHTFERIGTMYYLFIQGLKMDVMLIRKSGIREMVISLCGMILPYFTTTFIYIRLTRVQGSSRQGQFLHFLSSSIAVSSFPVIHPILEELNLLNSELGRLALSTSLINDVVGWIGVILFETWKTMGHSKNEISIFIDKKANAIFYLISMLTLVLFITFVIRPVSLWINRQTPQGRPVDRRYIFASQFMVLVIGFFSESISATMNNGPLIMGLAMPDGPPLASTIVDKTEDISQIFMSLFYATVGLNTNIFQINNTISWGSLQATVIAGYLTKIVGTMGPALFFKIPLYDAIALGFILNFRGFVQALTYANWVNYKLMGSANFTTMIMSTIFITAISVPLVRLLAKKERPYMPYNWRTMEHSKPNVELCVLTCLRTQENVPSIINLLDASNANRESPICIYAMTLVELVGRANPILIEHNTLNRSSSINNSNHIMGAFQNFEQTMNGCVSVRHLTVVAPYNSMYQDICLLALNKRVSLIIVPFQKQRSIDGLDVVDRAFLNINPKLLEEAPCSVGILVDRGNQSGLSTLSSNHLSRIGVVILGGPDCRDVLSYALRMAGNQHVELHVMRIIQENDNRHDDVDKQRDENVVAKFRIGCVGNNHVVYGEEVVRNGEETVNAIRSMGSDYDLMVVGRRFGMGTVLVDGLVDWIENPELGVFGDIMAAPDFFNGSVSVLVIQQQLTMGW